MSDNDIKPVLEGDPSVPFMYRRVYKRADGREVDPWLGKIRMRIEGEAQDAVYDLEQMIADNSKFTSFLAEVLHNIFGVLTEDQLTEIGTKKVAVIESIFDEISTKDPRSGVNLTDFGSSSISKVLDKQVIIGNIMMEAASE